MKVHIRSKQCVCGIHVIGQKTKACRKRKLKRNHLKTFANKYDIGIHSSTLY